MPSDETPPTTLETNLRRLGFNRTADDLNDLVALATRKRWSTTVLLEHIVAAELEDRQRRSVERRLTCARLGRFKPLADWDWIWSDLHLGHPGTISAFGRPFEGPEDMDKRLFGVWRRTVRPDDTIICLGDVVFSGLWGKRRKRVVAAPGRRKILVFGNHELGIAGVGVPGFDESYSVLYPGGDPPLLMTHFLLRRVPEGCVNLRGHLHNATVRGSTRHINVCVEQVHYRPRSSWSLKVHEPGGGRYNRLGFAAQVAALGELFWSKPAYTTANS